MVNIFEPVMRAVHQHSLHNRADLAEGGKCGCYHCCSIFGTTEVKQWVGKSNDTSLCPHCHYDTVIAPNGGPVDQSFLKRMRDHYFGQKDKVLPVDQKNKLKAKEKA